MKSVEKAIMALLLVLSRPTNIRGEALSIYEIQYTTAADGTSPQHGNIVDCLGGIVVHKSSGSRTKLTLYDPANPDCWGGIMAKDTYGVGAFAGVNVGDWISFANVEVEDFRGNTFLQYTSDTGASFTIASTGNPAPKPLAVGVDEIAAPIEGLDTWLVADHNAERYEGMLIKVIDVNVKDIGYGKAYDNYILQSNTDPSRTCWASDYMNGDRAGIYHPYVEIGQDFCGVTGILEQYTGQSDGIDYDYYQLLTTGTADFVIEQIANFDDDCDVDSVDFGLFAQHWLQEGCTEPDWCGGADLARDDLGGIVKISDLSEFAWYWLEGK